PPLPYTALFRSCHRRRGDQPRLHLLHLLTAASGTKRTSRNVGPFVRFRATADKHARVASAASVVNDPHVEILCAASTRVNVRIFYQPLTPPTSVGLLASPRGRVFPG